MINIAIIASISEYDHLSSLPGCNGDAEILNEILQESGKYDQILPLTGKINAQDASDKISKFITQYEEDIGEIFFYFSGHGSQQAEGFFYAFSDYQEIKKNSTGIIHSDLDQIFRNVSPKLLVKIVDACESGAKYIKSSFSDYLPNVKSAFNDIYFLFSSSDDQSSYQTDKGSYFTIKFAEAVLDKAPGDIRYIDLINSVKDSFIDNEYQTPYFVSQAKHTELFCNLSEQSKNKIKSKLQKIIITDEDQSIMPNRINQDESLNTLLSDLNKNTLTKEDYEDFLIKIEVALRKFLLQEKTNELYELIIKKSNDTPPGGEYIARWFSKNKANDYFVEVHYEIRKFERRVIKQGLIPLAWTVNNEMKEYVYVTDERKVPTYYNLTTGDISFFTIQVIGKYNYLNKFEFYVAFAPSLMSFSVFTSYAQFKKINWNSDKVQKQSDWKNNVFDKRNYESVSEFIEKNLNELNAELNEYIFSFENK